MRVLVASWLGSSNLGDELVFRALRDKLHRRGATVAGISLDPAATRRLHGVGAVPHRSLIGVLAAAGSADRLVFGGGGLVQDETSPFNLPYHLARVGAARLRGTPVGIVGVGASQLTTATGRALVRSLIPAATPTSVRDPGSATVMAGLGIEHPVVAADLALSLEPPKVTLQDKVVVALRPWSDRRARLPVGGRWSAGLEHPWFLDAAADALDGIAAMTGLAIQLVAFQAGRDDRLHDLVADRMRTPVTTTSPTLDEVLPEVASARVVVAMRYHAGIAAVLAGRPVALVGYSDKVPALGADVGEGAAVVPWAEAAVRALPRAVAAVVARDEAVLEARTRLRDRERGNDVVLDRVLG